MSGTNPGEVKRETKASSDKNNCLIHDNSYRVNGNLQMTATADMTCDTANLIEKEVRRFRCAIERAHAAGKFKENPFTDFPNGCCDDSSEMLARYLLEEHGIVTTFYLKAHRDKVSDNTFNHAWLEWGDYVIDITEDQTLIASMGAACGKPSFFHLKDDLHRSFGETWESYPSNESRVFESNDGLRLNRIYKIIISNLQ